MTATQAVVSLDGFFARQSIWQDLARQSIWQDLALVFVGLLLLGLAGFFVYRRRQMTEDSARLNLPILPTPTRAAPGPPSGAASPPPNSVAQAPERIAPVPVERVAPRAAERTAPAPMELVVPRVAERTAPAPMPAAAAKNGEEVRSGVVRFHRPPEGTLQLLPGRLEIVSGKEAVDSIRFMKIPGREPVVTFGRSRGEPHTHIELQSPTVSRRHAVMRFQDGAWHIANLSTTNPVVVQDRELTVDDPPHRLEDGDCVEMGEVRFRFHGPPAPSRAPRPVQPVARPVPNAVLERVINPVLNMESSMATPAPAAEPPPGLTVESSLAKPAPAAEPSSGLTVESSMTKPAPAAEPSPGLTVESSLARQAAAAEPPPASPTVAGPAFVSPAAEAKPASSEAAGEPLSLSLSPVAESLSAGRAEAADAVPSNPAAAVESTSTNLPVAPVPVLPAPARPEPEPLKADVIELVDRPLEERAAPLPLKIAASPSRRPWSLPVPRRPSRPVVRRVDGLSAREIEIAQMVADQKSNKTIGDALAISPRTVSTHLTHIYRKLDVTTRAELADYVSRHGLG